MADNDALTLLRHQRREDHLCVLCGEPAALSTRKGTGGYSNRCPKHRKEAREYQRRLRGFKRRNRQSESYVFNVSE